MAALIFPFPVGSGGFPRLRALGLEALFRQPLVNTHPGQLETKLIVLSLDIFHDIRD
jgi:hypothetical protein